MAKKKRKYTSQGARPETIVARERVLKEARRVGVISNDRAKEVGRWNAAWWHLNEMVKDGQLRHIGANQWVPGKRSG